MIDWSKAPEGATHAMLSDKKHQCWALAEIDSPLMVYRFGSWVKFEFYGAPSFEMVPRPEPRTENDELLDLIRDMQSKALEMVCLEEVSASKYNDRVTFTRICVRADINQQEEQS